MLVGGIGMDQGRLLLLLPERRVEIIILPLIWIIG
jgi:hypothetical protein